MIQEQMLAVDDSTDVVVVSASLLQGPSRGNNDEDDGDSHFHNIYM